MREVTVTGGPNMGSVIKFEQEYLYRGTNFNEFEEQIKKNNGFYCGCNDEYYGMGTFVALNIDGTVMYCSQNKPLLLAVRHEQYKIDTPHSEEGWVIKGLISLEDILLVTTEEILLKACPDFFSLSEKSQKYVKLKTGIMN